MILVACIKKSYVEKFNTDNLLSKCDFNCDNEYIPKIYMKAGRYCFKKKNELGFSEICYTSRRNIYDCLMDLHNSNGCFSDFIKNNATYFCEKPRICNDDFNKYSTNNLFTENLWNTCSFDESKFKTDCIIPPISIVTQEDNIKNRIIDEKLENLWNKLNLNNLSEEEKEKYIEDQKWKLFGCAQWEDPNKRENCVTYGTGSIMNEKITSKTAKEMNDKLDEIIDAETGEMPEQLFHKINQGGVIYDTSCPQYTYYNKNTKECVYHPKHIAIKNSFGITNESLNRISIT